MAELGHLKPRSFSCVPVENHGTILKKVWERSRQRGVYGSGSEAESGWTEIMVSQNMYIACVAHNRDFCTTQVLE